MQTTTTQLDNLFTIDFTIVQNKIQKALFQLNTKIKKVETQSNRFQEKFKQLQTRQNKFQKFGIDSFKATAKQVYGLEQGLGVKLGQQWAAQQKQRSSKNPNFQRLSMSDNHLRSFINGQQAKRLQSEQLNVSGFNKDQLSDSKFLFSVVSNNNQNILLGRQISEQINKKYTQMKKDFQQKHMKEIYKRLQELSKTLGRNMLLLSNKKIMVQQQQSNYLKQQIDQKQKNYQNNQQQDNNNYHQQSQQQQEGEQTNHNNDNTSNDNNNYAYDNQQLSQTYKQYIINNLIQTKQQIMNEFSSQMLQLKAALDIANSQAEKNNCKIQIHQEKIKFIQKGFTSFSEKLSSYKNQFDNLKNTVYQNQQRLREKEKKIVEHDTALAEYQAKHTALQQKVNENIADNQQYECRKLQQIQNLKAQRSGRLKGSFTNTPKGFSMIQDNIIMQRINGLAQRLQKIECNGRNKPSNNINGSLPRIQSKRNIGSSSTKTTSTTNNSTDLLRKQLQKTNQELNKTNQRVMTLKKNLQEMQSAHNLIPNKIQKLQTKINNVSQLREDRITELIKQITNRMLSDPFDNNFTNTLKKQIHVKFLQIKHEYASIWKEIQNKVTDRAMNSQLQKLKEVQQTSALELKVMINKKAQTQDFKKATKYLQGKVKDVYTYLKHVQQYESSQGVSSPGGKKYYMGKK